MFEQLASAVACAVAETMGAGMLAAGAVDAVAAVDVGTMLSLRTRSKKE